MRLFAESITSMPSAVAPVVPLTQVAAPMPPFQLGLLTTKLPFVSAVTPLEPT